VVEDVFWVDLAIKAVLVVAAPAAAGFFFCLEGSSRA